MLDRLVFSLIAGALVAVMVATVFGWSGMVPLLGVMAAFGTLTAVSGKG